MNFHSLLDNLTIRTAALTKFRYFSASLDSPTFAEHLQGIELDLPRIQGEGFYEVPGYSLVGDIDPAFHVAQWRGSEFPTLIYHHGINELPFDNGSALKNSFRNILLSKKEDIPYNLIAIRAAFHRSRKDYNQACVHLSNWIAMLAASTALLDSLVRSAHERLSSPIAVAGVSLGGWIVNMHRAYCGSADVYIPMLSGAAMEDVFLCSAYQTTTSELAVQNPETLKSLLNFELEFLQAPEMNVHPLLARHDQIMRYSRQKQSYGKHPVSVIEKGHLTGALAADLLRGHVLSSISIY